MGSYKRIRKGKYLVSIQYVFVTMQFNREIMNEEIIEKMFAKSVCLIYYSQ